MYKHIILGGTFDHFHKGHKALLDKAFAIGEKVTIGITKENLYKNKLLAQSIEPYEIRYETVNDYLKVKGLSERAKFLPLTDVYGSSINEKDIDAIIVSKTTYQNSLLINQKRSEIKFPPLKIIIVDDVLATDGKLLTSERIRMGEIDREGFVYADLFNKTLKLPQNLRVKLRKPLGKVFPDTYSLLQYFKTLKWTMMIAVGDIISQSLEQNDFYPDVKIIDYKSRRKLISSTQKKSSNIVNNPGTIAKEAVTALNSTFSQFIKVRQSIVIDGEEDLLALPAILLSPLNSIVLYGQMELGVVAVLVTEEKKLKTKNFLKKFTQL